MLPTDPVGRCRLTVSKFVLKALMLSALDQYDQVLSTVALKCNLRRYKPGVFQAGLYTRPLFSAT
jgi:hypothetical protein